MFIYENIKNLTDGFRVIKNEAAVNLMLCMLRLSKYYGLAYECITGYKQSNSWNMF